MSDSGLPEPKTEESHLSAVQLLLTELPWFYHPYFSKVRCSPDHAESAVTAQLDVDLVLFLMAVSLSDLLPWNHMQSN